MPERPPKEWFYPVVRKIEKEAPKVTDPKALAGWIWHHHMKPSTKKAILKAIKEGRKLKLGIRKITARMLKQYGALDPDMKTRTQEYLKKISDLVNEYRKLLDKPFLSEKETQRLGELHKALRLSEFFVEEATKKTLDPQLIKVRKGLINKPTVLGYTDHKAYGLIRVLEREDGSLFPEFAFFPRNASLGDELMLDSLEEAGLKEEIPYKWVLRTDKFNIFVYTKV